MACIDSLKTVNSLIAYASIELTVLSGFLPDELEKRRRDVAAQLLSLARFIITETPRMMPYSRQAYRVLRVWRFFSASRHRRAKLPLMSAETRGRLLDELLIVQRATWTIIHYAMLELEQWTPTPGGFSLDQISKRVLFTVSAVLRVRRKQLLRIPAALHCLNEFQESVNMRLLFGTEGIKNALKCGPLPDAHGQIAEVESMVSEVRQSILLEENCQEYSEVAREACGTEGAYSGASLPSDPASTVETSPSSEALTRLVQPLLSNRIPALLPTSTLSLPGSAVTPESQEPHSTLDFSPRAFQKAALSADRSRWTSEGSTRGNSSAFPGASQAPLHYQFPLLRQDSFRTLAGGQTAGHLQSSSHFSSLVGRQQMKLPFGEERDRPFYGVPLGAPSGPWPPERIRQPAGAATPFDLSELDFWARGFSDADTRGSECHRKKTRP
ncbi:hypothetical protein, conserved [Eimeria praecox]|uniref:Uncharacterized protein n=1 Tax=Eimeria praecox TaxID=51316 RepID=U6H498_9EIME|nr:hypothetical protein, conserved [Eimeria praecox]